MKWPVLLVCLLLAGCINEDAADEAPEEQENVEVGENFRPVEACPADETLVAWQDETTAQTKGGAISFFMPANGTVYVESTVGNNYGDSTWQLSIVNDGATFWDHMNGGGAVAIGRDNNIHGPVTVPLTEGAYNFQYLIDGFIEDIGTTISFTGCT